MSIATSQQINRYYETFKDIAVTYTKEVVKSTGLQPKNVFFKCLGDQWPCVIYSSSFSQARVLITTKPALAERIAKANNLVSVRLSFKLSDTAEPILFYVSGRVSGFAAYAQSNGTLQFANIQFTQRPPDDFVEIIGRMLEANVNSARRKDERILLTAEAMRKIGLVRKETTIVIDNVPRNCILRDLAFSGAKVILVGIAKFLVGKPFRLKIDLDEPRETVIISGSVIRNEDVEGRKDLTAIALSFDEATIPMSYKMHINDYLGQRRLGGDEPAAEEPATKA